MSSNVRQHESETPPCGVPDSRSADLRRAWVVGLPAYLQHDLDAYARLVAETPYLTSLQRDFYCAYFAARASKLFSVPA